MNITKKNVRKSGPTKDFMTRRCNFFTLLPIRVNLSTNTKLIYFRKGSCLKTHGVFQF
jgi:hypothetical protein